MANGPATKKAPTKKAAPKKAAPKRAAPKKAATRKAASKKDESPGQLGRKQETSRVEDFRRLAEAAARGEFVMLPRALTGDDRRTHVRQTLREDHQTRIAQGADEAQLKFDKLAGSLFSFFRGTALLFYRDMAGGDAWMPTVLTLGDVHPENFGVMPNASNVPIFGVNDFDEADYAPFTWDLKRGATGFMIAAEEVAGYGRGRQCKIAARFVRGYIDAVRRFAGEGGEQESEWRIDNAPDLVRDLITDAQQGRAEWLAEDYLDEFKRGFRSSKKLTPISERCAEFQKVIDRLVSENDVKPGSRAGDMKVKDVAIRHGQGTASLGLDRFYVLIEGPRADGTDDLIIELKQARRSALTGLVPPNDFRREAQGDRIAHAQAVQLVRGDVFFGSVEFDGTSFMTRERAPYRDDIDLDELSKSEWKRYAEICGAALAHAHSMSDDAGELDYDVEPMLLEAIAPDELFVDDIVRFASAASDRLRSDHEAFKADHELGAFRSIDVDYR